MFVEWIGSLILVVSIKLLRSGVDMVFNMEGLPLSEKFPLGIKVGVTEDKLPMLVAKSKQKRENNI